MNIEKKNYEELLQKFYTDNKEKKYYKTKEVMEKTGISLRTLRYRISTLKEKYKDIPALLYKENNTWYVHRQLLREFLPMIRRTKTLFNMKWRTFITWVTVDGFDDEYHHYLATEIKNALPSGNFDYVIEQTRQGVNHVHMVTDKLREEVTETVEGTISRYLPKSDYRLQIEAVNDVVLCRNYMNK